jgi:magnesium-transporting ATPase (P-type)
VVISLDKLGKRKRVYVKGAGEILIDRCTHFLSTEQEKIEKTPQNLDEMKKMIDKFNRKALRTIVLAYRDLPLDTDHLEIDEEGIPSVEKTNLTLIAIIAILDPVKEGISDAIELTRQAAIKVFMVTGDSIITAKAVGKESGILLNDKSNRVWDGESFYNAVGRITRVCKYCKRPMFRCECSELEKKERVERK